MSSPPTVKGPRFKSESTPNGAEQPNAAARQPAQAAERGELASFRRAIENQSVSFHQVARAWSLRRRDCGIPEEERREYEAIFPELLDEFGAERGGVISAYFCEHIRVAAALTNIRVAAARTDGPSKEGQGNPSGRRRLRSGGERDSASSSAIHLEPTFGDPASWRAKEILFRCLDLHYRSLEFLKPKPRKICMRMTFNVITALLGTLDARQGREEPASSFDEATQEVACFENELTRAEEYYERSAGSTAQIEYFFGMVWGLAVLALLTVGIGVGVPLAGNLEVAPEPLVVSLLAGAAGAVVSVMTRATAGKLALEYEAGKHVLRLLGGFRPVIGAVSGLALYVLLMGGLVNLPLPEEPDRVIYFYAGLAFVAGFSERLAQDMLGSVRGVPPPRPEARPDTPPAGDQVSAGQAAGSKP